MLPAYLIADEPKPENKLKFYCAVNLKIPFENATKEFTKLYGTEFTGEFKGTGDLMGSVKINNVGDLFIAADASFISMMQSEGILKESLPLAKVHPVIIVQKGNPKGIKSLEDFKNENHKIVLQDPKAGSIGKVMSKILTKTGDWDAISNNATKNGAFQPTVAAVANSIKMKAADAAFVWDTTAKQKAYTSDFDVIELDVLKGNIETPTIGVLSNSKNPTLALKFARFLHAKDKGQTYFKTEGFEGIVNADIWDDSPTITLFSGGMNRISIEKTITEFQKREGITINTNYNGCGILVGQMKAGSKPDAYFACDASFMNDIKEKFGPAENLSQTNIAIIVKKGNPLKIKSLEDLTKPGIKIGTGHPEQSALGALTKKLLDSKGLYEKIKPNISAETPSADMIVAQFKAGSLDVCLVYETSVSYMKNEIEMIKINDEKAIAVQPYAIANYTNNHYLLERFLEALKNNSSNFTNAGFNFLPKKQK